jgi:ATP-binding cassette subfamily C protein LapB
MKQRDIPQGENMTDAALAQWAQAFGFIATRYRVACSPGALIAGAPWLKGKPMVPALTQLAREAGLSFQLLTADQQSINSWRLPVVVALNDGRSGRSSTSTATTRWKSASSTMRPTPTGCR